MTWTYLLIVDKKITGDQLSLAFSFLIVYTWWLYLQFYLPRFVFLPSLCMPVEGEPVGGYSLVSPTERGPSGGGREPCRCPPPDPQGGGQSGGTKFETHRAKILQRKHWTFSVKDESFSFGCILPMRYPFPFISRHTNACTLNICLKNICKWLKKDLFELDHCGWAVFTSIPYSHTNGLKQVVIKVRLARILHTQKIQSQWIFKQILIDGIQLVN